MNSLQGFFAAIAAAVMWSLVASILTTPGIPRPVRFDDLVWWVRRTDPDADVCEIDRAARPFERGEPGSYTYDADWQRFLPGMETA